MKFVFIVFLFEDVYIFLRQWASGIRYSPCFLKCSLCGDIIVTIHAFQTQIQISSKVHLPKLNKTNFKITKEI